MRGCGRDPGGPRHRLGRPRRDPQHAANAGDGPRTGHGRLAGGRRSSRGERGGRARSCDRGPGGPRHRLGRPRRDPQHVAQAREEPCAGHGRLAGGRRSSGSGQGERKVPRPRQPHPHPHQPPQSSSPPSASPRGGSRTSAPRRPSARRRASPCCSCKGSGTPGEWSRKGAAAGGSRAQAADGATQGRGPGRGQGTGRARRGTGRESRCRGQGAGRWVSGGPRAWGTGGGTRDTGRGLERGPRARARAPRAPRRQAGRGMGAQGGGQDEGRGAEGGAPPQPDVQPLRCIPPGIQQMPAHHTHHHHHHHHHHLYNIDPDAGELVPPQPPRPRHQPAPPAPGAEPARMALAEGGRGAASAPQAQGQRGGPARGAEGGRPWDRDWGAVPDPLGEETLPLVGEVYGWLCWANQGTSRRSRNRPFDAVLLRRDGGNREVPPGGWAAPEDHERVLRSVIRAAWPHRGPTWPAFLEGGAVLRITDADANNWLPRALRSALAHWRYRRHNPPPPQPQPPYKRRRR